MGVGVSVFTLVVGAIFVFALTFSPTGLDVPVVGIILMAAGGSGLLLALAGYVAEERQRASQHQRNDTRRTYWSPRNREW